MTPQPNSPFQIGGDQTEVLRQSCEEAFQAIVVGLRRTVDFARPLARLDFCVEMDLSFNARVISRSDVSSIEIEINDGLLGVLYDTLEVNEETLVPAVLWPLEDGEEPPFLPSQAVLETLFELSVHFVLHHEIFHVLCGHLDLDDAVRRSDGRRTLDERFGHLEFGPATAAYEQRLRSYFLELEADALAVEWMLDQLTFRSMLAHLNTLDWGAGLDSVGETTLSSLSGKRRILGFRFLVTTIWTVIALMEANRSGGNESHPLPAARLIAAIQTLMVWYCQCESLRLSETGEVRWRPREEEMGAAAEFWRGIMKPIVMHLQDFPDAETARRLALPGGAAERNNTVALLGDIGDLLARRPPTGLGARQLLEVGALRFEMERDLAAFRYLEVLREGLSEREDPSP